VAGGVAANMVATAIVELAMLGDWLAAAQRQAEPDEADRLFGAAAVYSVR